MFDLFSDFFNDFDMFMQPVTAKEEKKCPVCGRTYSDFRRTGKIGCGECYRVFRPQIEDTLRHVQPSVTHTGKIPSKSGEELRRRRQYESLKAQLSEAVKKEDYETAAKLHRQIRDIESEAKKS